MLVCLPCRAGGWHSGVRRTLPGTTTPLLIKFAFVPQDPCWSFARTDPATGTVVANTGYAPYGYDPALSPSGYPSIDSMATVLAHEVLEVCAYRRMYTHACAHTQAHTQAPDSHTHTHTYQHMYIQEPACPHACAPLCHARKTRQVDACDTRPHASTHIHARLHAWCVCVCVHVRRPLRTQAQTIHLDGMEPI